MTYLSMYRGDDRTLSITASETLTGSDVAFTARRRRRDVDAVITKTTDNGGVTIGGTDDTVAEVTIDAADTETLEDTPLALHWDIEITNTGGDKRTVAAGRLAILTDITTPVP